ncbi:ygjD [Wigglesworthia glossinidia endosymbiont of Glossina brevipalpis]|uniref:tRNA N6-adenosine threonylcarbamoyltransferase n=1 Tax=Wigglesworthia glossinidia brevipalpis TaxID=36870 RepID=TSAD_WIGBR|nr:RecName: Full=tRNA N6-adenosine threonylcarbamoyltransferase; AltName: Full=N6-L-threonylcarbamoyladenine synthase; Short=t(6)A synthase; AltName: Full=t(6)A37 threonylcarbamoyladenosine biosynthesis protein TsaD; AltName: Full=tRNA threonylcarbamoyladenosine biosynthesis protein TsaD [Wigglesworthia glossinidia endosymbiont of Glossina brevipalpis]BAC24617.1 ygjD [Wigglesworthia glossinidia endosymbiont of Glossina brevipalpis]
MLILGIETSCDDTGAAIYDLEKGLIIHKVISQNNIHSKYGGVVPEKSSKYHLKNIQPLVENIFKNSNISLSKIDGIAYTAGPGLVGSLIIGATFACSLAYTLQIPSIAINHLEGHLLTPMIKYKRPKFPFLGLIISGAHTQFVLAEDIGKYKIIGDCLDDALGEAFDKVAKLLGIKYPGGKKLSIIAKQGNSKRFFFPRPMTKKPGINFSFSGLKTYAKNLVSSFSKIDNQTKCDIARAFEDSIIDTVIIKCKRALDITNSKILLISGGVSANEPLRKNLRNLMKSRNGKLFFSKKSLCTDNAAMIAYVGSIRFKKNKTKDLSVLINPKWSLEDISRLEN